MLTTIRLPFASALDMGEDPPPQNAYRLPYSIFNWKRIIFL